MPRWTRVRDKSSGHEFDINPSAFDPESMTKVNAPKQYPDLDGPRARPRPAKFRTDKAGQPATDTTEE